MNRCAYQYHQQQQKAAALVGFGCVSELRRVENCSNTFSMANTNGVVCPKPRRIVNNNFNDSISIIRPSRFLHNNNQQMEACESKAGIELLDIIRPKQGDYGFEKSSYQVASSPPFYSGSPPVRASNPLIQDEQFRNEKLSPPSPSPSPSPSIDPPMTAASGGGGRGRVNYRHNQPNVRVEGFNCSVYAIA
jgi:hypothetical protein